MSCFFCFSAFPIGVPNHCGQWGETLLWPDFSTLGTCSVFAAKYGEETPISTDTWHEEDLKEKYIFINQQYYYTYDEQQIPLEKHFKCWHLLQAI